MREHESFLMRLDETVSRMSGRLARWRGERAGAAELHERLEALRREIAQARRAAAENARADLARVRASLEDLRRDYDAPLPHATPSREELEAFGRHLRTSARLVHDLATADSPTWDEANEEYERSWAEVERAFEPPAAPASP